MNFYFTESSTLFSYLIGQQGMNLGLKFIELLKIQHLTVPKHRYNFYYLLCSFPILYLNGTYQNKYINLLFLVHKPALFNYCFKDWAMLC